MAYKEDNTINHEITGNERFRLWGAKIKKMLEEVGLTRTEDTGQINWETVEWPAAETDAGYEIWRFNDALQASRPIYIKLFYGRGGGEKRYRLGLQVGNTSNGSGTLEGGLNTRGNLEPAISAGFAALGRIHVCYLDSELLIWWCGNPAQSGGAASERSALFYHLGRLRDPDGTIRSSAEFADVFVNSGQGNAPIGGGNQRNGNEWTASISNLSTGQSSLVNNVASPNVLLPYSATVGRVCGPLIGRMPFTLPSQGDTGKVEMYGKERTYIKAYSAQMAVILMRE